MLSFGWFASPEQHLRVRGQYSFIPQKKRESYTLVGYLDQWVMKVWNITEKMQLANRISNDILSYSFIFLLMLVAFPKNLLSFIFISTVFIVSELNFKKQ